MEIRMNFAFSEEQDELRKSVRRFLDDKSPETEVRRLMETTDGYDPAVWNQMAEQLGLQSLTIPEEFGGSGFTYVELIVVLEEMGASLLCAPFFSTVALAANAVLTSGDQSAMEYLLPGIAAGETIGTLAFTEDSGRWDADGITLAATPSDDGWVLNGHKSFVIDGHTAEIGETIGTLAFTEDSGRWDADGITLAATPSDDGWVLNGHKSFVIDGHTADLVLVVGRSTAGLSLFGVKGDAEGLTKTPLATMDQTRKQARREIAGSPAWLIGSDGGAGPGLSKTLDLAAVALAAEQVGGAQRCLDSSVEYAKTRIQFGRPIGSFQAIKHKCADMLLEVESAKSAAYYAAWAAAEDNEELPVVASLGKAYCSDAYFHAAAENIQIHGGIGFTWEHPAHLYFKRAKSSEIFLGDPAYHRELLAQRLGI